jgi:glutamine---fructose-6-phosphate transaminase (isomerizing)
MISEEDPDVLIAARMGSPLTLGIGEGGEYFIASDGSAFLAHTRQAVHLNDGEVLVVHRGGGYEIRNIVDSTVQLPNVIELVNAWNLAFNVPKEGTLEEFEKGGFPHFMLKEIMEQPDVPPPPPPQLK